jgi:hypothetical protein
LESYRIDAVVDINDNRIAITDSSDLIARSACSVQPEELGPAGEFLVRPAGLINLFAFQNPGFMVKSHFANLQPAGLPPLIPKPLTYRAIYVVRDPRDVAISFSSWLGFRHNQICDAMSAPEFVMGGVGDDGEYKAGRVYLSTWSNHVASWTSETEFPVHVVRYEDMVEDTERELAEIVAFLEWDLDEGRVTQAVENCKLSRLAKAEKENGFKENAGKERQIQQFFNKGGSRWRDELAPIHARRIEKDHGKVMQLIGYEIGETHERRLSVVENRN